MAQPGSRVEPASLLPSGATRRVPLGLQVFAGIGSLVALVALAVVIGVVLVSGLGNGAAELTDREVEYARAIDAAALKAKAIANDERGFLLSDGRRDFVVRLEGRVGGARNAFEDAARAAENGAQRDAVRQASLGFEEWLAALRAELATFDRNPDAAIASALGPTRELRHDYERTLERAQLLGDRAIESGTDSVSSASTRSVMILLAYLLVAFAAAAFIAVWLVRTILRPVYALLTIFAEPGAEQSLVDRYSRHKSL